MATLRLSLAVALGTVIGGTLRWLVSEAFVVSLGAGFAWATLFVNVTGSFLIGLYAGLSGPDGRLFPDPVQRQFVMTGICGGYTTFSIFSLETVRFAEAGRVDLAAANIGVSVMAWMLAVWAGYALASRMNRLRR